MGVQAEARTPFFLLLNYEGRVFGHSPHRTVGLFVPLLLSCNEEIHPRNQYHTPTTLVQALTSFRDTSISVSTLPTDLQC
jgi:hypothetical protein